MADNRTERATPRRRDTAREKGQVLRSRDLVSAVTVLAAVIFLAWDPGASIGRWRSYFSHSLGASVQGDWTNQAPVMLWTGIAVGQWAWPILAVALLAAIGSTLAQGGLTLATAALTPDWQRLNPAGNVKSLFSPAAFSRVLKSLLPSGIILYLALNMILHQATIILHAARLSSRAALALIGTLCFSLAWQAAFVLLAWSGIDYLLQRQAHEKSLRMTKQEVKQEGKDTDGNPQTRGRFRRLRREMLRKSLQRDVKQAPAVVTNPIHYAVAIEYRPATMVAPVVVAKGRNLIAQKIKELARWHDVPIVENPPLAQALYKAVDVGQMIPPKLYAAVAEILAFLYRAQMRMKPQDRGTQAGAVPR